MKTALVKSLHIYPIKSCRGLDVPLLDIQEFGPQFDREWMIVDEKGLFVTQRTKPQMAQIQTAFVSDCLQVAFEGQKFLLGLDEYSDDVETVKVWSSELMAHREADDNIHKALSDFLGQKVSLVRYGPLSHREAELKHVGLGAAVRFADRTAIMFTNTKSLDDLNQRMKTPIEMNRFRPNIVVDAETAWEEDRWTTVKCGSVELEVTQTCGRCPIITVDQMKGVSPSKEPLTKLAEFRRGTFGVEFGIVAVQRSLGSIRVGDQLQIS